MKRALSLTTPLSRSLCALLTAQAALFTTAHAALRVTLELVTSVPAQGFGTGLGTPFFAGGVYYSRTDDSAAGNIDGLYRGSTLVTAWGSLISGNLATSIEPIHTDGTTVLLSATTNHASGDPNTFYNSLNVVSGGTPLRILSRGSALPGYPSPHPGNPIGPGTVEGSSVAFLIREAPLSTPRQPAALATATTSGGDINVIVREGDALPNGGGTLRPFSVFTVPYLNGGRVVFAARGSIRRGIYEWSSGGLNTIVDSASTTYTVNQVVKEGANYAFITGGETSGNALFRIINGTVSVVANTSTPVPGGTGTFLNYSSPSLRNGKLLFHAWRINQFSPPNEMGIYTDLTGVIEPVVDMRTNFGGKTPRSMSIPLGCAWAGDGLTYVHVAFTDLTDAIYRVQFSSAPDGLPSTTVFTGPRRGTITFPTQVGSTYHLRRTSNFQSSTVISSLPGNGSPRSLSFDDTGSPATRAFFYVEQTTP